MMGVGETGGNRPSSSQPRRRRVGGRAGGEGWARASTSARDASPEGATWPEPDLGHAQAAPSSRPRLAQTRHPVPGTVSRPRCAQGWAQPESRGVELFVDRLPDRYVCSVDMDLNGTGTPGEASGDFECPVPENVGRLQR
jgi:hypothetical protein